MPPKIAGKKRLRKADSPPSVPIISTVSAPVSTSFMPSMPPFSSASSGLYGQSGGSISSGSSSSSGVGGSFAPIMPPIVRPNFYKGPVVTAGKAFIEPYGYTSAMRDEGTLGTLARSIVPELIKSAQKNPDPGSERMGNFAVSKITIPELGEYGIPARSGGSSDYDGHAEMNSFKSGIRAFDDPNLNALYDLPKESNAWGELPPLDQYKPQIEALDRLARMGAKIEGFSERPLCNPYFGGQSKPGCKQFMKTIGSKIPVEYYSGASPQLTDSQLPFARNYAIALKKSIDETGEYIPFNFYHEPFKTGEANDSVRKKFGMPTTGSSSSSSSSGSISGSRASTSVGSSSSSSSRPAQAPPSRATKNPPGVYSAPALFPRAPNIPTTKSSPSSSSSSSSSKGKGTGKKEGGYIKKENGKTSKYEVYNKKESDSSVIQKLKKGGHVKSKPTKKLTFKRLESINKPRQAKLGRRFVRNNETNRQHKKSYGERIDERLNMIM